MEAETTLFAAIAEGHIADAANRRRKAIEHYTESASLWRDLQDRYELALCLQAVGLLHSNLGENQKALEYYQQALPIWHALGDRPGEGTTLNDMGSVYQNLGEKQKALDYYQQVLPLQRSMGNRAGEAYALGGIGIVYSDLGEKQKALEYFSQALRIFRAIGDRAGTFGTLLHLNLLYRVPAASTPIPAAGQPAPNRSPTDTPVQRMVQAGHPDSISAIAFSPEGRSALTASNEKTAIFWSVDDGKEIRRFEGHESRVTSVAFLPDGNSVATGSKDKTVRIWDLHTGQELQRLTDSMPIQSIVISPKGDLIATAATGNSYAVHLLDRQSSNNIRSFEGTGTLRAVAFSPDGKWLCTGTSADQTIRLSDVATGGEIRSFPVHDPDPAFVYLDAVVDDVPSALIPRVSYQAKNGQLEARIRLRRDNKVVADDPIMVEVDPVKAARQRADGVIKAAIGVGAQ